MPVATYLLLRITQFCDLRYILSKIKNQVVIRKSPWAQAIGMVGVDH